MMSICAEHLKKEKSLLNRPGVLEQSDWRWATAHAAGSLWLGMTVLSQFQGIRVSQDPSPQAATPASETLSAWKMEYKTL